MCIYVSYQRMRVPSAIADPTQTCKCGSGDVYSCSWQALAQSLLAKAQALLANDKLLAHRSVSLALKLAQTKLDRATHLLDQSTSWCGCLCKFP